MTTFKVTLYTEYSNNESLTLQSKHKVTPTYYNTSVM